MSDWVTWIEKKANGTYLEVKMTDEGGQCKIFRLLDQDTLNIELKGEDLSVFLSPAAEKIEKLEREVAYLRDKVQALRKRTTPLPNGSSVCPRCGGPATLLLTSILCDNARCQ